MSRYSHKSTSICAEYINPVILWTSSGHVPTSHNNNTQWTLGQSCKQETTPNPTSIQAGQNLSCLLSEESLNFNRNDLRFILTTQLLFENWTSDKIENDVIKVVTVKFQTNIWKVKVAITFFNWLSYLHSSSQRQATSIVKEL